jgi:prenyltransferase beta subunit
MKTLLALGFLAALLAGSGKADDAPASGKPPADRVDQAIARALDYLVSVQDKDGAITEGNHNHTAMTALAIMAMAAVGNQPSDETKQGIAMKRALSFVLRPDRQEVQGYFGGRDGSRMYGHGITTLMLSEMLGMGVDAQMDQVIRDRCRLAVDLIKKSQSYDKDARNKGGWRYAPDSRDSDLSVTVWQVMALRSARNAGMDVPKEMIDNAVEYIKRCYQSKRSADGKPENMKSACGYEPSRAPEYAMASAGLLSMQVCGAYDSPEVKGSADWLKEKKIEYGGEWFFYGTYYFAQGMFQRGGEYSSYARKLVEDLLLPKQGPDGSWQGQSGQERGAGKVYATSLAVLSLAVKFHFLPIYQR